MGKGTPPLPLLGPPPDMVASLAAPAAAAAIEPIITPPGLKVDFGELGPLGGDFACATPPDEPDPPDADCGLTPIEGGAVGEKPPAGGLVVVWPPRGTPVVITVLVWGLVWKSGVGPAKPWL